jgi:hypothetical protein
MQHERTDMKARLAGQAVWGSFFILGLMVGLELSGLGLTSLLGTTVP